MATAPVFTSQMSREASALDCPVCTEPYKQPKVLPCGHLLCRPCLITWGHTQPEAQCPLCRCDIVDASSEKSFQEVVDSFPTDLTTQVLVESKLMLKRDHTCQFCAVERASTFCLTCWEFFCAACAAGHTRMGIARDHKIENLSSLTPKQVATDHPSFCSEHTGNIGQVYCRTHNVSVCIGCANTVHKHCRRTQAVEEVVEESVAALEVMTSTLRMGEYDIDQMMDHLDQHLKDTQERLKVTAAEMEASLHHLEQAVEEGRQRLLNLLEEANADIAKLVSDAKTLLMRQRGKLTTHRSLVEHACGMTSPDVVGGMASSMRSRVNDLSCSATLPEDTKVFSKVKLVIDPKVMSWIESEISRLGKVEVIPGMMPEISELGSKVIPVDDIAEVKTSPAEVVEPSAPPLPPVLPSQTFCFHDNHGGNIALTDDRQTAERKAGSDYRGIVMSRDPIKVNTMYEVEVEETVPHYSSYSVRLGVVTQNPDTVRLPDWSVNLPSAVVVGPGCVIVNGVQTQSTVGKALGDVRGGGRVGLVLDSSRHLHLFMEDRHVALVFPSVPHPCYFMVDLCWFWRKVTALPTRPVNRWT